MSFTETIFSPFFDTVDGSKINSQQKVLKSVPQFSIFSW